jgi:hypothetical protein
MRVPSAGSRSGDDTAGYRGPAEICQEHRSGREGENDRPRPSARQVVVLALMCTQPNRSLSAAS